MHPQPQHRNEISAAYPSPPRSRSSHTIRPLHGSSSSLEQAASAPGSKSIELAARPPWPWSRPPPSRTTSRVSRWCAGRTRTGGTGSGRRSTSTPSRSSRSRRRRSASASAASLL